MAGLDVRQRHLGLAPMTPLPRSAEQTAVMAVLLQGFVDVQWSTESADVERLLGGLRALFGPGDRRRESDAR